MNKRKKNDTTMKIDTETLQKLKNISFKMGGIEEKRIPPKETIKRVISNEEIKRMLFRGSMERKRGLKI